METKIAYQVIRYNRHAHVCHDQVRHISYHDTREQAEAAANNTPAYNGEVSVRKVSIYA